MPNSQYERDFNDLGALKRPGRLDFKTLNNVDDAGDGHPGMQKAIRNYFHEGYLEKDINMNTHKIINLQAPSGNNDGARKVDVDTVQNDLDGFDDELKGLSSVEVQQLQNIDSVTISNAQWGYLGGLDQSLAQAQSPTFVGLNLSADLVTTSTVDGVDVSDFKNDYDTHKVSTGADHSYIDQSVVTSVSPTFVGLTLSANLVTTSTVDGVDISTFKSSYDTHEGSSSNPHSVSLEQARTQNAVLAGNIDMNIVGKIVNLSAPSSANDSARRQDLLIGVASTITAFTNSTLRSTNNSTMTKLKEIICKDNFATIVVYWGMKSALQGDWVGSQAYLNGSPVGDEVETYESTTQYYQRTFSNVYYGDLIQIWGRRSHLDVSDVHVLDMEIRFSLFENNDP